MQELITSALSRITHRNKLESDIPSDDQRYHVPEGANPELKIRPYKLPKELENSLSSKERLLKKHYESLVRAWAYVYNVQEGPSPGTNYFYPDDATEEEVKQAAQSPGKTDIISRYAVVIRDPRGSLTAIPYHRAYRAIYEELNVDKEFDEAIGIAGELKDPATQVELTARKNSLITGGYKTPERFRQNRKEEPLLELVLGFFDTNTDNFGIKLAAQAWATLIDREKTDETQWFLDSMRNFMQTSTGVESPKAKMRIGYLLMISGQAAKKDWIGNNLPYHPEWREEFGGSKFEIFIQKLQFQFRNKWFPAFWASISPGRRVGMTKKEVEQQALEVFLRKDVAHEYSHSFVPASIDERLGKYANYIKELYCELIALDAYGNMPSDPLRPYDLTNRERDFALAAQFAEGIIDYETYSLEGEREEYYVLNSTILKYLEDQGSVWEENGRLDWDNTKKVYQNLRQLLLEVQYLIHQGSWSDAAQFFRHKFGPEIYKKVAFKKAKRSLFMGKSKKVSAQAKVSI